MSLDGSLAAGAVGGLFVRFVEAVVVSIAQVDLLDAVAVAALEFTP